MVNSYPFTPFFGVVESLDDPYEDGRIKVRVHGYHSEIKQELPTEMLRWMLPIVNNSAALDEKGKSPTGYHIGTTVFGYFIDPDCQDGIIQGALSGKGDTNRLAKGEKSGKKAVDRETKNNVIAVGETWSEPPSEYGTVYPYNKVMESMSGHTIEIDDTPNKERINIFHKSGTFIEMFPDGRIVSNIKGHKYSITYGNENVYISGNSNVTVQGNCNLQVEKNLNEHVKGDVTRTVDGNYNIKASGDVNIEGSFVNINE